MRETSNIKLTQFDGTDVPNWLDQYNSDMSKIDTAIGAQSVTNTKTENDIESLKQLEQADREQINENTQDIATIKQTDLPSLTSRLAAVETESGSFDARLESVEDGLTSVETTVGTGNISNVADSITSAIGNAILPPIGVDMSGVIRNTYYRIFTGLNIVSSVTGEDAIKSISGSLTLEWSREQCNIGRYVINLIINAGTINKGYKTLGYIQCNEKCKITTDWYTDLGNISTFLNANSTTSTSVYPNVHLIAQSKESENRIYLRLHSDLDVKVPTAISSSTPLRTFAPVYATITH